MADLDYTIGVRTDQAERNIDRLKKSVGGLGAEFTKFRNVIGGLAIGGLITNTIRWADSIQDVSDSTGIATATILGFGQAVAEAGGTSEGANNALVKFNQTLGEAQQGSKSAQTAFANLGITVDELKSLSSEAIFSKTLAGLRDINSLSRQAAASADLFGKTLKGVDLRGVATNTGVYAESNVEVAKSVKSAADAQQNLEKLFNQFQKTLLDLLRPISELVGNINTASDTTQRWVRVIVYLTAAIAAFVLILNPVARVIGAVIAAIRSLYAIFRTAQGGVYTFSEALKKIATGAPETIKALKNLRNIIKVNAEAVKEFNAIRIIAQAFQRLSAAAKEAGAVLFKVFGGATVALFAYFKDEADELIEKFQKFLGLREKIKPIPYDQGGPQGGRRVSPEVLADIAQERAARERAAKEEMMLKASVITKQRQDAFAAMNEQLGMDAERAYYADRQNEKTEYQRNLMEDIALLNQTIFQETGLKQLAQQNELIGLFGREYEAKAEILAIDAERENTMNEIYAKLRSLGTAATQEDIDRANQEIELAKYVADERLKIFQDRVAKETAIEQSAVAGVKAALQEITQAVTPFNVAQESTRTLFDGMKQGITDFATTGKLNFKTFALSLIRDLLMVQAQAAFTQLFGMGGNFLASLFGGGKAAGGPVKGNTAYVVGEKGPELFVPKGAGTIVPNNKMNSGSGQAAPANNTYNTYNISAIDSQSVAQFFAQNRKMALGAVEMAKRELPYGVG
jgi:lambda family phage tail tape measure protein